MLKLRKAPKQTENTKKLDIARLKAPSTQKAFNLELKNPFRVLENRPLGDDIQESWNRGNREHHRLPNLKEKQRMDLNTNETGQKKERI